MTTGRLLIPLDGSKLAEHSLAYVATLVPLGVREVELVSVLDPTAFHPRAGHDDTARERNLVETYLRGIGENLGLQTSLKVTTTIAAGPAATAIQQVAHQLDPDFLVISTHGASGLSRWRLGSVADKVIRAVECPTLVVGPRAAEREEELSEMLMPVVKTVVVPLDGSPAAEQALPVAQRFAEAVGAELHLVTAVSVADLGTEAVWAGISPQLEEELTHDAQAYLERVKAATPALAGATLAARFGAPAEALTEYVTENDIDLVVMTSHGRGGLLRTALGSTTDRMLGGDAPVLVVRAVP